MNGVLAYVAVGSNLGDRQATIQRAIHLLNDDQTEVLRVSALLQNPAVGGPADSPDFLNGAIEVRTTRTAGELLTRLLEIEQHLGRDRRQRWAPRTIDLDLLLFGDEIIQTDSLTVPHPRLNERRFVLQPLEEIAASVVVPGQGKSVSELLGDLDRASLRDSR